MPITCAHTHTHTHTHTVARSLNLGGIKDTPYCAQMKHQIWKNEKCESDGINLQTASAADLSNEDFDVHYLKDVASTALDTPM